MGCNDAAARVRGKGGAAAPGRGDVCAGPGRREACVAARGRGVRSLSSSTKTVSFSGSSRKSRLKYASAHKRELAPATGFFFS